MNNAFVLKTLTKMKQNEYEKVFLDCVLVYLSDLLSPSISISELYLDGPVVIPVNVFRAFRVVTSTFQDAPQL